MRDSIRDFLRETLKTQRKSMRWLSLQIGRKQTYIRDYLEDGVPTKLKYEDCLKISRLLDVPLTKLGVELPPDIPPSPEAASLGYSADIEIITEGSDSHIAARANAVRCKVLSRVLNQHPVWALIPGDHAVIDKRPEVMSQLRTGSIVLAYLHDKDEDRATPILREFVEPSLLITNTTEHQLRSILDIRDANLPFDVLLIGKLTFAGRGNGQAD